MGKDWQRGQAFMNKDVKTEKVLGVGKDGYPTGGVNITKEVPCELGRVASAMFLTGDNWVRSSEITLLCCNYRETWTATRSNMALVSCA